MAGAVAGQVDTSVDANHSRLNHSNLPHRVALDAICRCEMTAFCGPEHDTFGHDAAGSRFEDEMLNAVTRPVLPTRDDRSIHALRVSIAGSQRLSRSPSIIPHSFGAAGGGHCQCGTPRMECKTASVLACEFCCATREPNSRWERTA